MKILCTICARGGSTGVKNKNIKFLNGKPLIYYTIKIAQKSKLFEDIVVSTDSEKILKISEHYGVKNFFLRPKKLSTNRAPKIPVIKHALLKAEKYYNKKYDYIIDLDATTPLRVILDIKKAFNKIIKSKSDLLISVNNTRANPYFNSIELKKNKTFKPIKNLGHKLKRRQDSPKVFDINASIFIWKRKTLLRSDTYYVKRNSIYVMPEERSYDIDTKNDFKIVSYLMKNELYRKI
tara:strand:- start:430 stop:1137 length:708 start_codon:yes stop_codon:yes gene_type:complete